MNISFALKIAQPFPLCVIVN